MKKPTTQLQLYRHAGRWWKREIGSATKESPTPFADNVDGATLLTMYAEATPGVACVLAEGEKP